MMKGESGVIAGWRNKIQVALSRVMLGRSWWSRGARKRASPSLEGRARNIREGLRSPCRNQA